MSGLSAVMRAVRHVCHLKAAPHWRAQPCPTLTAILIASMIIGVAS